MSTGYRVSVKTLFQTIFAISKAGRLLGDGWAQGRGWDGVEWLAASLEPELWGGSPLPKGGGGSLSTGIGVLRMGRGDGV